MFQEIVWLNEHPAGSWNMAPQRRLVNHDDTFQALLSELKLEGRYRTFAEFERIAGAFPAALRHRPDGSTQRVTVW